MIQRYLGDGVYAEHDGFQFRLWTLDSVSRDQPKNEIYLEDMVLRQLVDFDKEIKDAKTSLPNESGNYTPTDVVAEIFSDGCISDISPS